MKKILSVILALTIMGTLSLPAFASESTSTITVEQATLNEETKNRRDELKEDAADEEEMLQISSSTLLKLKIKLEEEGTAKSGEDMAFIANKYLKASPTPNFSDTNTQFLYQKTTDENGTISIQFRPRENSSAGIYQMTVGAPNAELFRRYYKTLKNQVQPTFSNASDATSDGYITLTVTGYSDDWKDANKLYIVTDGGNTEVGSDQYSFEKDSNNTNIATLKISATGDLGKDGEYTLKFIPTEEGGPYNPITFNAKVTEKTYKVTLDSKGGSSVTVDDFKKSEITDSGIALSEPTKTGYTFEGWYTKETSGTDSDKITAITTENLAVIFGESATATLYAYWTPVSYSITYNLNGGTNADGAPTSYTVESETITLGNPTKQGYTFAGWYENEACTGTAVATIPKGTTGAKTFYAKWEEKSYTITLDAKNGSGTSTISGTVSALPTLPTEEPKKAGYTFGGWYTEETSGTKVDAITAADDLENLDGKTLYAQWTAKTYTITLDLQEGTGISNTTITGTVESLPSLPTEVPTKSGCTFSGWATQSEQTVTADSLSTAANMLALFGDNTEITLYAQYVENGKVSVKYSATGAENVPTDSNKYDVETVTSINIAEQEPTKKGYIFAGWKVDGDDTVYKYGTANSSYAINSTMSGSITFIAQWNAIEYTITLDFKQGTGIADTELKGTIEALPTLPDEAPSKNGYTFKGWYTKEADGTEEDKVTAITSENLTAIFGESTEATIYAYWTPIEYSITYNLNGGENPQDAIVKYTIETAVTLPNPTKSNHTFDGWYDNENCTGTAVAEISAGTTGDKAFYAKWTEIDTTVYRVDGIDKGNSKIHVTKRTADEAWVIVATYKTVGNSNILVKATIKDITNINGVNQEVEMAGAFESEHTDVKVFVWDNLNNMKPLCGVWTPEN